MIADPAASPPAAPAAPTVVYLVSLFPCWSETFILREILAVRERQVNVRILSLRPPRESLVQATARPLLPDVVYPPAAWRLVTNFAAWLIRDARMRAATRRAVAEAWSRGFREIAKALYTLAVATSFIDVLQRLGAHHVHAPWATYPALAARVMREVAGIKFTFAARAHDIFLPNPYLASNVAAAHRIVTISDYNRRYLVSVGTPADKLLIVHSALDFREFDSITPRPATYPPVILAIGRLELIKGFTYLLDACALLRDRGVPFRCDIVGDGSLREELRRKISTLKLDGLVYLRGLQDSRAIRGILTEATVFALPCVRTPQGDQDGIPNALMEAMAVGLPVVTTPISGIPELVFHGRSGLLVQPENPAALADSLEQVLTDPDLRETLSAQARQRVRATHDVGSSADRLRSMFLEVINA